MSKLTPQERFAAAVARRDAALVYGAASNGELLAAQRELRTARAELTAGGDEG